MHFQFMEAGFRALLGNFCGVLPNDWLESLRIVANFSAHGSYALTAIAPR